MIRVYRFLLYEVDLRFEEFIGSIVDLLCGAHRQLFQVLKER